MVDSMSLKNTVDVNIRFWFQTSLNQKGKGNKSITLFDKPLWPLCPRPVPQLDDTAADPNMPGL